MARAKAAPGVLAVLTGADAAADHIGALTAHLIVPWETCSPRMLAEIANDLARRFHIGHVTIQLEPIGHGEDCERALPGVL